MNKFDEENPANPLLFSPSETSIRLQFIRKVYIILLFQLLLTMLITLIMMHTSSLASFFSRNYWILFIDGTMIFIIMMVIMCFSQIARKVPTNYILLAIFTLGFSLLVGCVAAMTDPTIVLMAAIMTFCVTFALMIYAYYTKTDFTYMGGFFFIFWMVFMVFEVFKWLWEENSPLSPVICAVIVMVYGGYMIYNTKMIMKKNSLLFSEDDYVFAAMFFYIFVIAMFVRLMKLMGLIS